MSKKNKKRSNSVRKPANPNKETKETLITVIGALVVLAIVVGIIVVAAVLTKNRTEFTSSDGSNNSANSNQATYGQPESPVFDEAQKGIATHEVTMTVEGYGDITMELYGYLAPQTVENFVSLIEQGFYDGLTVHRIIKGFMVQGGCPEGNGTGGSDHDIYGEFTSNGYENNLAHTRGVVSMARSGDPNSASSQFFIMHQAAPHLDGSYAAFGFVTSGMNVVDALCNNAKPTDDNGSIAKADQPVIKKVTVTALETAE